MQYIIAKIEQVTLKQINLICVVFSMLIAAQMQYIQHGWINPDSVLYFESARLIALGNFKSAMDVFNWPLYSACIAAVHKLTTLNIHQSAQALNLVFFAIATSSFLRLITLVGGNKVTLVTGALILFSSSYIVGGVLEMLMRDQGFWAFYLSSLVFFIHFYKHQHYRHAFWWQVCAIIATLFRIEAITYLIFMPALLLFNDAYPWPQRFQHIVKVNFLNIIAALAIATTLVFSQQMTMANFGRLKEIFSLNLWHELSQNLISRAEVMSSQVLGSYLDEFALQGLLLTFIFVMIVKTISAAGFINTILSILTLKYRYITLNQQATKVLIAAGLISLINMSLIITKVFVLSTRYVVGLAFMMMIFASFALAYLINQTTQSQQPLSKKDTCTRWFTYLIIIFMLLSAVKNMLPKRDGYNYMQDATAWVKAYNKKNDAVFYDETRIRFYLDEPFDKNQRFNWASVLSAVEDGTIKKYDILMISHSKKQANRDAYIAEHLPEYVEIKRFNLTKNKKSIVIYKKLPVKYKSINSLKR